MAINRKLLEQELKRAGQITQSAVSGEGFDPRGGYGVLAAQLGTAAIGAFAEKKARDKLMQQEELRNQKMGAMLESQGLSPDLAGLMSPATKDAFVQQIVKSKLTTPAAPKYDIREGEGGFVRIDPQTGTAEPIKTAQGGQLKSKIKSPETVVNIGDKRTKLDEKILEKSFEAATGSEALTPLLGRAEELVNKLETGPFANVAFKASKLGNILTAGAFDPDALKDYQELESISKEFGARTLDLFGGNDSNRELLVAIETNVSADKKNETNLNIIKRKKVASDILRSKPDFQISWVNENGSILEKNKANESFAKSWRKYQEERWKKEGGAIKKPEIEKNERQSIAKDVKMFLGNKKTTKQTPATGIKFLGIE